MMWIFTFIYQISEYELSNKQKIEIRYRTNQDCNAYITFMKGYEIYKIDTKLDESGYKLININEAKLIPTRRKPIKIPFTIESDCNLEILSIDFK